MQRLPVNSIYILLSRKKRLFESIDYWPSAEICFIRRTVACIETTSCC